MILIATLLSLCANPFICSQTTPVIFLLFSRDHWREAHTGYNVNTFVDELINFL